MIIYDLLLESTTSPFSIKKERFSNVQERFHFVKLISKLDNFLFGKCYIIDLSQTQGRYYNKPPDIDI